MAAWNGIKRRPRLSRTEDGVLKYRCTVCKAWKAVGDFYGLPRATIDGSICKVRPMCRSCDNAARTDLRRRRASKGR